MGSSEISVLAVRSDGLELRSVVSSGGSTPNSITVRDDVVYTITRDGRIALLESIAATTTFGQLSIRDAHQSRDGRYLYAIDITSRMVHAWGLEDDGSLTSIGAFTTPMSSIRGPHPAVDELALRRRTT
ncbi:MAG: hypothetical protein H0W16_02440 [Actinobacteria bacterium]|nr:hypothetical protein [Actinomycetota bacterium]